MNKRILYGFLGFLMVLSGCGGNSDKLVLGEVSASDQAKPTSTNLEYNDYGIGTKPEFDEAKWYRNDLKDMALPDPAVIEVGDGYYIYGTTDRTGSKTLDCYYTTDFNNIELFMNIENTPSDYWGEKTLFAPEVYFYDNTYWLYYSDVMKGGLRYINVMTSESPSGPFVPYKGKNAHGEDVDGSKAPLFMHNKSLGIGALDQTLLFDDDGSIYMYYSLYDTGIMQYIVGVKMLDPVTPDWDTYKILIRPGELSPNTKSTNILSWEAFQSFKVAEGPFMLKSPNGKYYLTYSVNHYPDRYYSVCYAYSDTPLGDFTKPYTNGKMWTNLLFGYAGGMKGTSVYDKWTGFMSGTGHHCFFKCGDQVMIGYHAHTNHSGKDDKGNFNTGRMFAMDYIYFDDEGTPYAEGPTYSIQPLPSKISGYSNIALNSKIRSTNVNNVERAVDNRIVEHYHLTNQEENEVQLNAGNSYIELIFDKEYHVGGISIYNSAYYDTILSQIDFINFFDGNAIIDVSFQEDYINNEYEFVFPTSAFVYDFADITASKVVIGFKTNQTTFINEIRVFGY